MKERLERIRKAVAARRLSINAFGLGPIIDDIIGLLDELIAAQEQRKE